MADSFYYIYVHILYSGLPCCYNFGCWRKKWLTFEKRNIIIAEDITYFEHWKCVSRMKDAKILFIFLCKAMRVRDGYSMNCSALHVDPFSGSIGILCIYITLRLSWTIRSGQTKIFYFCYIQYHEHHHLNQRFYAMPFLNFVLWGVFLGSFLTWKWFQWKFYEWVQISYREWIWDDAGLVVVLIFIIENLWYKIWMWVCLYTLWIICVWAKGVNNGHWLL